MVKCADAKPGRDVKTAVCQRDGLVQLPLAKPAGVVAGPTRVMLAQDRERTPVSQLPESPNGAISFLEPESWIIHATDQRLHSVATMPLSGHFAGNPHLVSDEK